MVLMGIQDGKQSSGVEPLMAKYTTVTQPQGAAAG